MFLPEKALYCINALEQAGFAAYAVGGCVRDALLGLTPADYDLCTAATPEQIREVFRDFPLIRNGEKHGTVGVILDKEVYEITTFRTEGGYQDSRHPDWVRFVTRIEEDLARRDFTVNAMAYSPTRGLADPWGGQQDLKDKILRAVGDPAARFEEDALRILRGVRFAVRFGLTPEPATFSAMEKLSPNMDRLARERVFSELCKLIVLVSEQQLQLYAPILVQVLPELAPTRGFDQRNKYHIHDIFTHTALVVEKVPQNLALRWAALLHDIGKPACFSVDEQGQGHFYGHAQVSAEMADQILLRLKAPTALRETVVFLIGQHMVLPTPDKKLLRKRLGKYGRENLEALLLLQEADHRSTRPDRTDLIDYAAIRELLQELYQENACLTVKDLAINGNDLLTAGFAPGPSVGKVLAKLLDLVQEEQLPNEKTALLEEAKRQRKS